jgi:uncharacterized protein (DUF2126 family)
MTDAEIQDFVTRFAAAWAARDGNAFVELWHPEGLLHTPLVFDLIDTWNFRSIGGCTYHVVHPGGRSYERFPVNANEAEARRMARFTPHGHTPGAMEYSPERPSPEFPFTLDLRRAPDQEGVMPNSAPHSGQQQQ